MPDLPILTSPAKSLTLRRLVENLEVINLHLDDAGAWRAAAVGGQYIHIEADDSLVSGGRSGASMRSLCTCSPDLCTEIFMTTAGRLRSIRSLRDDVMGALYMRCLGSMERNPVS